MTRTDASSIAYLETIQSDITTLKENLAMLMGPLKIGTKDGINEASGRIGGEAMRLYETIAARGERSSKSMGRHVEDRPVIWLPPAFAVGFIGGRVLSR